MKKFTDVGLKNLKPKANTYDICEGSGNGFLVRVFPSGEKSFGFFYSFEGKRRRMTFGKYPAISLSEARDLHSKAVKLLAKEQDPAMQRKAQRLESIASPTVNDLVNQYLEKWAKPRKRSWEEDQRILNKDILPSWGKHKAKDITRRHVNALLDKIVERGSPIIANRTLAVMRRMFNFAVERDIIEISPCYAVKAPAKENKRDRFLTLDEIKSFWQGLDNTTMSEFSKITLKFQLVTAQRKGEIVSARWDEIDLKEGWWTIPAGKAKNNNQHRVPLSVLAIALLKELKPLCQGSPWLFLSPKGDTYMSAEAVDHALRKNFKYFSDIEAFTPHDLRRTAASQMTALGISRLVVSKILNHVEGSVTAIYDRHSYDKEKQLALQLWAEKLCTILDVML